jgi:hypothetical protein
LNRLSTQSDVELVVFLGLGKAVSAVVVAVALAAISACAMVKPRSAEEIVQEKAQARWDALVKGDTATAYRYFSPGTRTVITPEGYDATINKGFWKSAKIEKVTCETAEACEVLATIEYEYQRIRTKTPLRETWIREGSDWWYVRK